MTTTTIKLDKKTKTRLDKLRVYKRESYDEIVQSMLDVLNTCRISPERARAKLIFLDRTRRRSKLKGPASVRSSVPVRSPQSYSEIH